MADTSQPNRVVLHIDADTAGAEQKIARVEKILTNAELSEKSKVASVAALYKKQGMEASAAMQKAWQQVRGSAQSAAKPVQEQCTWFEKLRAKAGEVVSRMKQFGTTAKTEGDKARKSFSLLNATATTLSATFASLFAVTRIIAWGKACVTASGDTENALRGLSSVLNGQGRDFSDAENFIQDYISDGLVPLQNAVTAYKNLAARGYDDAQIRNVMLALKDSAAYGRQASYTLGEAVTSATDGLKNENSVLVDNAGVTKNVAKMWDEYAASIGTTSNKLTQQQKIQAEVNGILTETRYQTGDAAKVAGTFSGQVAQLSASVQSFNAVAGDFIKAALVPAVTWLTKGFQAATIFLRTVGDALGITTDTAQFASNIGQAVSNTDALTDSVNAAKKAQDKLLAASFDEFNVIGQEQEDEESGAGNAADTTAASSPIAGMTNYSADVTQASGEMDTLTAKAREFGDTWLLGWETIKTKWTEFKENWLSGWEVIKEGWEKVKTKAGEVWEIATLAWGYFKDDWQTGWETIQTWWDNFKDDWQTGWETIQTWWNNFKENWQSGWETIQTWWNNFKENWQTGWETIQTWWNNFKENWQSGWETIKEKWAEFKEKWKSGWETIKQKWDNFKTNWKNGVQTIKEKLGEVKEKWNDFKNNWKSGVDSIKTKLTEFKENWKKAWDNIRTKASEKWDSISEKIKEPFQKIGDWFHDTFSKAWERVKNVFSSDGIAFQGIQDGIYSSFKTTINGLIDGLNNTITVPFWNIKEGLRVLREWEFAGMNPFYWMPDYDMPTIPRLAKGGIISQPTLAMVGDNPNARTDPEIVSPLSKLRSMLPESGDPVIAEKLDTLIRLLELILSAVQESDRTGGMGDKEIYAAAMRGKRRYDRMKGAY